MAPKNQAKTQTKNQPVKSDMPDNKALMKIKEETADLVLKKVQVFQKKGELDLPPNYSAGNALKSAWLLIQEVKDKDKNPALQVCTKDSIARSLLYMVIQGLNPAKSQCYFIVYGKQLTLQRSYFGTKMICFQVDKSLSDIYAEAVYEGDKLEYRIERGRRIIENHIQNLENIDDSKIIAAYAVAVDKDGEVKRSELMTIDQLKKAWSQSKMYPITDKGDIKPGSTHAKFTGEMAKKTVTSRMAKNIINTTNDSSLVIRAAKETDDELAAAEADMEASEYANSETIDIESVKDSEKKSPDEDPFDTGDEMTEEEKAEILAEEAKSGIPDF